MPLEEKLLALTGPRLMAIAVASWNPKRDRTRAPRGIADQVLGVALNGQEKYDESIGVLQGAYAASLGDVQPMFALVNALVRAQQVDRAAAFLQTVISNDPANAEAPWAAARWPR